MKLVYRAELLSILFVSSLACGQKPTKPTSQAGPPPLELKLTEDPLWKGNCVELRVQRTNTSKFPVFVDVTYGGIKVYSSVSDATNTLGQGAGKAWMIVYGWTDVVSEPIELAPGARRQDTLCIGETFPVKEAGKEMFRQVHVRGNLRTVAEYSIPTWRIIDRPQGKGRRTYVRVADDSKHWTFGEVVLEFPIPCPNGIRTSNCLSPPEIFPGEHDVHTFELEPPPVIEFQLPPPPIVPVARPSLPKP